MSRTFNGTTQYLDASSTLLTNEPIGIFCWFNPDNVTTSEAVITLGNNGTNGYYSLSASGTTAGDPVRAVKNNDAGTGNVVADTTTGFSASTWQSGAAAFRSDTSRDAYINGGSKGSNTTSRTDPTPDFITIGALHLSTGFSALFGGSIASAFLFDIAPTDAQMTTLALGVHPIYAGIPFANLRGWYQLLGDDNNRMSGGYPNLTATGSPTFSNHPPKVIPPRLGSRCSF